MSESIVEVIVGRQRRRRWTVAEKLRIIAESNEPGTRIGDIAARYDLYPSLLFTWRRQVRKDGTDGAARAVVPADRDREHAERAAPAGAERTGSLASDRDRVERRLPDPDERR